MDEGKALSRAAALCSRSEQCEADISKKLITWLDGDSDAVHRVIARLKGEGFIDDYRYARAYVHDKFNYNGWGRLKLKMMLRAKQLPDDAIAAALDTIDPQQYLSTLEHAMRAKWRAVASREPRQARAALVRHAAARGFEADVIFKCINTITGTGADDEPFYD